MSLSLDFQLSANPCDRERLSGILPNGMIKKSIEEEELGNHKRLTGASIESRSSSGK